ncbi:unnamed protein product [Phaeothamnion confervicola]
MRCPSVSIKGNITLIPLSVARREWRHDFSRRGKEMTSRESGSRWKDSYVAACCLGFQTRSRVRLLQVLSPPVCVGLSKVAEGLAARMDRKILCFALATKQNEKTLVCLQ